MGLNDFKKKLVPSLLKFWANSMPKIVEMLEMGSVCPWILITKSKRLCKIKVMYFNTLGYYIASCIFSSGPFFAKSM